MEVRDHGSFDVKLVREFTPPLEVLGLAPRHVRLNRRPANEKQVLGSIFFLTSELPSGTPGGRIEEGERQKRRGLELLFATCLLYTSPSPRDRQKSRMPSSA